MKTNYNRVKGGALLSLRRVVATKLAIVVCCCVAITISYSTIASGETQKEDKPKKPKFGSVARISYNGTTDGESSASLSYFGIFPSKIFIAASLEYFTEIDSDELFEFENSNLEINVGRPMSPKSRLGRSFGWVARFTSTRDTVDTYDVTSIGLQWNINESLFDQQKLPWKTFLQVFVKDDDRIGTVDLYNWFQINLFSGHLLLRATNAYYIIPHEENAIRATQDIIFPVKKGVDLYLRHFYQNRSIDLVRSKGSQFLLGIRFSLYL